jgi:hypothetical protein
MNPARELALKAMVATQVMPKPDFLLAKGIATPMPVVSGALPQYARVFFPSLVLKGLPVDLVVVWTIGDFPGNSICSSYYDPRSPWYNVFYGAYGILSHKRDGTYWGFKADGTPNYEEMFEIPELDYNYLTAGQLGCPPAKQHFEVLEQHPGTVGAWSLTEAVCKVPSGLHHLEDSLHANPLYYSIFGYPDQKLIGNHESYEPVTMRGQTFFRKATTEDDKDKITLTWGAMCPDTEAGQALLKTIIAALRQVYP